MSAVNPFHPGQVVIFRERDDYGNVIETDGEFVSVQGNHGYYLRLAREFMTLDDALVDGLTRARVAALNLDLLDFVARLDDLASDVAHRLAEGEHGPSDERLAQAGERG